MRFLVSKLRIGVGLGLLLIGAVRTASAQDTSVCDRTAQVRDAIVAASGAAACGQLTLRQMREITALDLQDQGIAVLRGDDFDGLVRLDSLDLADNLLTSLPAGVFDELYLLRTLHLDGNLLETLPADIFKELFLLEELKLGRNRFSSLPDGLFDEFSRFDGMQANGDAPDNTGSYPRIKRFLTRHSVTSPEQFIAALPDLYKERFVMVYESQALAAPHVSGDHPRIASWGAHGHFIFAWNTDPEAPGEFRESIEFLRQDHSAWSAGVIDFSGASYEITEPSACQVCHGSINKPLWGAYNHWQGTEAFDGRGSEAESGNAATKRAMESADPRIEPLDFSLSSFPAGKYVDRVQQTPGYEEYVTVAEEAGAVWSWRHAEVLSRGLKDREDFRQFAEQTVCQGRSRSTSIRGHALGAFPPRDGNLALLSNTGDIIQGAPHNSLMVTPDYRYHMHGSLGGALVFLMVADLWQHEPIVRKLYRDVSNTNTLVPGVQPRSFLHYGSGSATAEDELIQKLRIHFGAGGRTALGERAGQNGKSYIHIPGNHSASFFDGHLGVMASRVCNALTETKPTDLSLELMEGAAVLTWEAPEQEDSLTGYRILRGMDGGNPKMHVANTGSTDTTWSDENPEPGELVYEVQALYDGYYASPESNEVRTTVPRVAEGVAPVVAGSNTFIVPEGNTAVATLAATDEDTPAENLTWSLSGGTDQNSFTLSSGGDLAFAAAKDYEAPDDTGGDGIYNLTVEVSDGAGRASADISVTLANRNEPPTANAGPDLESVEGGSTVTLRGAGEDTDTGDTLSYSWTQTNGASVTLSDASSALATFVAPADLTEDATLRFVLRVTDGESLYAEDEVEVSVTASASPLTARIEGLPNSHDGSTDFTFELWFSEEIDTSYATLRDTAVETTGGTVRRAQRLAPPSSVGWQITVEPTSKADVVVVLHGNRACDSAGGICTASGKQLSNRLEVTVLGPDDSTPLTAEVRGAPETHDGETPFTFELRFSEEVDVSYATLRDTTFETTGGAVRRAQRLGAPSNRGWRITVEPASNAPVVLTLPANRACNSTGGICTASGKQLSNRLLVTVLGPDDSAPLLTAEARGVPQSHDGETPFTFELWFSEEVDVSYTTIRDTTFGTTGGAVRRAQRLAAPSNLGWTITVEPASDAPVVLLLPANRACGSVSGICTASGKRLSNRLGVVIMGPG